MVLKWYGTYICQIGGQYQAPLTSPSRCDLYFAVWLFWLISAFRFVFRYNKWLGRNILYVSISNIKDYYIHDSPYGCDLLFTVEWLFRFAIKSGHIISNGALFSSFTSPLALHFKLYLWNSRILRLIHSRNFFYSEKCINNNICKTSVTLQSVFGDLS